MTRRAYIEMVRRQIYGGQPSDDATITINLVNLYLEQAIAYAAKTNYKENIAIGGISYVNNSFYTTFKGLSVTADEQFIWKITLPQIPFGIGADEGISTLQFKDGDTNQLSLPVVWLTQNQKTYYQNMRGIPNKLLAYSEGKSVYAISTILLNAYTANVTLISGGDSTDLSSNLNVPNDYFPVMMQYLQSQLLLEKAQPVDSTNDGIDIPAKTT